MRIVTFMKVFLLNDLLPILPVRRPVAELLLRSVNNLQRPSGRGARGAEKVKVNMFILHFFRLFSIYCQRVKVPPVKEDGAQLWRDLRTSSRSLVWARHISSNIEQYFFEKLFAQTKLQFNCGYISCFSHYACGIQTVSIFNSIDTKLFLSYPWILTLGVNAGLKDSTSLQNASSSSSLLGRAKWRHKRGVHKENLRRLMLNVLNWDQTLNSRASSCVCVLSVGIEEISLPKWSTKSSEVLHLGEKVRKCSCWREW